MNTARIRPVGKLILVGLIAAPGLLTAAATHASHLVHEATYTSSIQNGWVRVERWRDTRSGFGQEAFPPDGRGDQSGQRVTFSTAMRRRTRRAS